MIATLHIYRFLGPQVIKGIDFLKMHPIAGKFRANLRKRREADFFAIVGSAERLVKTGHYDTAILTCKKATERKYGELRAVAYEKLGDIETGIARHASCEKRFELAEKLLWNAIDNYNAAIRLLKRKGNETKAAEMEKKRFDAVELMEILVPSNDAKAGYIDWGARERETVARLKEDAKENPATEEELRMLSPLRHPKSGGII